VRGVEVPIDLVLRVNGSVQELIDLLMQHDVSLEW
jgi:hypothetical protein